MTKRRAPGAIVARRDQPPHELNSSDHRKKNCTAGQASSGTRRLEHLESLWLANTKINDSGLIILRGVRGLKLLSLTNTNVTDAGLVHLDDWKCLRKLDLTGTHVTDDGVAQLQQKLPKCEIFW